MLPHYHAIIAATTVIFVSLIFFPDMTIPDTVMWTVVGSIIAAIIDLDAIILVNIKSKKEPALQRFQSIKTIAADFNAFINTMAETGILKTILSTHVIFSAIIALLFYVFLPSFLIPVALGIITHLLSDIKYIGRI
jgi:hypothetical protein